MREHYDDYLAPAGLVPLSKVLTTQVRWLWDGYIPLGKLTVIDGNPGTGKTAIALDLCAKVTAGRPMPDGRFPSFEGNQPVIYLSAEDGAGDTIKPRLLAAGGDDRFAFVPEPDREAPFNLDDPKEFAEWISSADAKLAVIDPLQSFVTGKIDLYRDQDARGLMRKLAGVADQTGCAIIVIRHLNKANKMSAIQRGGGNMGIVGAARAAYLVERNPEERGGGVFVSTKMNLAPMPRALPFRVVAQGDAACVEWGEPLDIYADDLLQEQPRRDTELERACGFVREQLAGGPILSAEFETRAKAAGLSESTLNRARRELGVECHRRGNTWCVELTTGR